MTDKEFAAFTKAGLQQINENTNTASANILGVQARIDRLIELTQNPDDITEEDKVEIAALQEGLKANSKAVSDALLAMGVDPANPVPVPVPVPLPPVE